MNEEIASQNKLLNQHRDRERRIHEELSIYQAAKYKKVLAGSDIGTHIFEIAIVTSIGFELKNKINAKMENQRGFCEVLRERERE